jgi:hypothetical protein
MLFALLWGCTEDTASSWIQFNAQDNSMEVVVGSVEELDPVNTMLTSTSGETQVGMAWMDPGGGPVGTVHEIRVEIVPDYETQVERASVRTQSGDRGEDEFDLTRDSAGLGLWIGEIQSVGEAGEVRTDTLTVRLWQEDTSGG